MQFGTAVEWDAVTYHRASSPQFEWGQKVLSRVALRGDETVIDAGCGTGRLTAALLERLPRGRVIAVDASDNMIDQARAFLTPRFGDRIEFVKADLARLELDGVADGVFSAATFHWVLDQDSLYRRMFAALRPGGWLVAQAGGAGNLEYFDACAHEMMRQSSFVPYFTDWREPWVFADEESAARRLREAGFVDVKAGLEPALARFADAPSFAEFIERVVLRVHLARIGDEVFREQFVALLTEQFAAEDPPFVLDYVRLNLEARRPA